MTRDEVVDWLEGIVFGGVAVTTAALEFATGGHDVSFAQWRAILLIGGSDDGCRVGEVASFLHAGLPATSRLLRRMERRGLLTLERDERDRRATRARLTDAGTELRRSVLDYRRAELTELASGVTAPKAAERVLRELADRFEERGRTPPER